MVRNEKTQREKGCKIRICIVNKEFLKREWQQALNGEVTPNCRQKCSGCGAMGFGGGVCFETRGKNQ